MHINIRHHSARLSCFQQNASLHQFEEQPVERLFPELQQLPSKLVWVLWLWFLCICYWLRVVSNWVSISLMIFLNNPIYVVFKSWLKTLLCSCSASGSDIYENVKKVKPPISHLQMHTVRQQCHYQQKSKSNKGRPQQYKCFIIAYEWTAKQWCFPSVLSVSNYCMPTRVLS